LLAIPFALVASVGIDVPAQALQVTLVGAEVALLAVDVALLAVDVAFRMAWGTLARQIMYGPTFESHRVIAWDTLVAELGRACASYLLGAESAKTQRVGARPRSRR